MSRSLPEACHTTVARKFQMFNLGTSSPHPLGSIPYPSFPALCHDDTTFHGGTDYGEYHATSVTQLLVAKHVQRASLGNYVLLRDFGYTIAIY